MHRLLQEIQSVIVHLLASRIFSISAVMISYRCFIAFAIISMLVTILLVQGQSTVQGDDIGDLSNNIVAEMQQLRLIIEAFGQQVQGLQKLHDASFQEMSGQHDIITRSLQAIDRRLIDQDIHIHNQTQNVRKLANDFCSGSSPVRDCSDIRASGYTESGVYQVYVRHQLSQISTTNAFCDMKTTNGSWLVFQRRKDGSEDFFRTWNEYAAGFGDPSGEFWLGNEMLHFFTTKRNYKLRIDLEDFEGQRRYAEYSSFVIGSSAENYRLTFGNYSGNAGDSLSYHNGDQFTTKDADHDRYGNDNCAQIHRGAWWYSHCGRSNLNGIYRRGNYSTTKEDGVFWRYWHGYKYSLKITEMKLAPMP